MFDRFSDDSRKLMGHARSESERLHHGFIGAEHIVLALRKLQSSNARRLLLEVERDIDAIVATMKSFITVGAHSSLGQLPFTPAAKKCLELALEYASIMNDHYIGSEHVLLGLIECGDEKVALTFKKHGITLDLIWGAIADLGDDTRHEEARASGITHGGRTGQFNAAFMNFVYSLKRCLKGFGAAEDERPIESFLSGLHDALCGQDPADSESLGFSFMRRHVAGKVVVLGRRSDGPSILGIQRAHVLCETADYYLPLELESKTVHAQFGQLVLRFLGPESELFGRTLQVTFELNDQERIRVIEVSRLD